ncbi:MAG: hypothetical protein AB8G15_16545 [Saprospiraceae bacterium]
MKQALKYAWTFILAILFLPLLQGQEYTTNAYDRQAGYWTLGLNAGLAYQQSDVCSVLDGYGFGLTLAKNFYYRPGAIFAFDIRGRALFSQTVGLDDTRSFGLANNQALNGTNNLDLDYQSLGYVYQNYQTNALELGLEGVLSFNRLRERTNVILSLFGGIGLDFYQVKVDQLDAQGQLYDYDLLGENPSSSDIRSILDNDYETISDGFKEDEIKLGLMPNLGIELGYQFTPRFSMGIGHKVTFTQVDFFDGQQWKNDNTSSVDNDIHHYTNLHLRFIIDEGRRKESPPPIIEVTRPYGNPYATNEASTAIRANIKHVKSSMDVEYFVNGQTANFNYNGGNFSSQARLRAGRNEVLIKAHNNVGSDEALIIINYSKGDIIPPAMNKPEVDFIKPSRTGTTVAQSNYEVRAYVYNVFNKSDIEFTLNGTKQSNSSFSFDEETQVLRSNIQLALGENYLRIAARNKAGRDQENTAITYERTGTTQQRPRVQITSPNRNPFTTDNARINIKARIDYVSNKRNVQFYVNGRINNSFNFSGSNFSANVNLRQGNNEIKVSGRNQDGEASDVVTVIYNREVITPPTQKPRVTITSASMPTTNPLKPNECRSTVIAKILNITSKSNIRFSVNGRSNNNFSFNTATREFVAKVDLSPNDNTFVIKATNSAGSDQDQATVTCESSKRLPIVTITLPTKTSSSTTKAAQNVKATTKHVRTKNDIEFKLNGQRMTNFSFNSTTGIITNAVTLKQGNNTIEIKVRNNDGTDQAIAKVKYNRATTIPKNPPVVSISKPSNNATVKKASLSLVAKALNVGNKNDIKITLNSRNISNFSYNIRSKAISTNLTLKEGKNTIVVSGTNKDGNDEAKVIVNYQVDRIPPSVDITSPRNNSTTDKNFGTVKATVKNITKKSQIKFSVNGKNITGFTYLSGKISAPINLKEGKNTVLIKVTNSDGDASDQIVINYKKAAAKPVVKITNPSKPGISSKNPKYTVKATTKNVAKQSELSVKVNNRAVKNFSFKNNVVTLTTNLKRGNNSIVIQANTAGGTAKAQTSIIYTAPVLAKAPIVKIVSTSQPTVNPLNPDDGRSTVIASVLNVSSKNDIKVTVNGKNFTGFSYNSSTKQMVATVSLKKGKNTIVVTATNSGGSDQKTTTVNF